MEAWGVLRVTRHTQTVEKRKRGLAGRERVWGEAALAVEEGEGTSRKRGHDSAGRRRGYAAQKGKSVIALLEVPPAPAGRKKEGTQGDLRLRQITGEGRKTLGKPRNRGQKKENKLMFGNVND